MGSVGTDLPRRATVTDGVRQLARPVGGSVIMGRQPLQPQPRAVWSASLAVEAASASEAREIARWFLSQCRNTIDADIAVLLVSELVTNAVSAMAEAATAASRVDLSLRLFPTYLLVEVADSSPRPPVLSPPSADALTGRGLTLVDDMSQQWGFFYHNGRKIVFFILEGQP